MGRRLALGHCPNCNTTLPEDPRSECRVCGLQIGSGKARDEIDAKGKFDPASLRVEDDGAVAGSCAGSRPDDRYAVRVRVGPSGAVEAACECPAARKFRCAAPWCVFGSPGSLWRCSSSSSLGGA